jgi:hypothetical protein
VSVIHELGSEDREDAGDDECCGYPDGWPADAVDDRCGA